MFDYVEVRASGNVTQVKFDGGGFMLVDWSTGVVTSTDPGCTYAQALYTHTAYWCDCIQYLVGDRGWKCSPVNPRRLAYWRQRRADTQLALLMKRMIARGNNG